MLMLLYSKVKQRWLVLFLKLDIFVYILISLLYKTKIMLVDLTVSDKNVLFTIPILFINPNNNFLIHS